jgi:A/G-specific adenine glycosylase
MRDELSSDLLEWYDVHAREMPWRVPPALRAKGVMPDPYRIWMSEVMLQQTTVAAVKTYFMEFTTRWPTVMHLAAAQDADVMGAWAGLGYYARARNLLKCARVVADDLGGVFPTTREGLLALPGIGPYTASAVSSIAYDHPATVVDGNVERVISRLYDVHVPLPTSKPELTELAEALTPDLRAGDYAQAIMDLGATLCTPRNPACGICPWRDPCAARKAGTQAELPKKLPKKQKPTRFGIAYVARRDDGAYLLETRPDKGLLGGMLGWPGSDWGDDPQPSPPMEANWQEVGGEALHTFTHFHLRLKVMTAEVDQNATAESGAFVGKHQFKVSDLPTVMRKVFHLTKNT